MTAAAVLAGCGSGTTSGSSEPSRATASPAVDTRVDEADPAAAQRRLEAARDATLAKGTGTFRASFPAPSALSEYSLSGSYDLAAGIAEVLVRLGGSSTRALVGRDDTWVQVVDPTWPLDPRCWLHVAQGSQAEGGTFQLGLLLELTAIGAAAPDSPDPDAVIAEGPVAAFVQAFLPRVAERLDLPSEVAATPVRATVSIDDGLVSNISVSFVDVIDAIPARERGEVMSLLRSERSDLDGWWGLLTFLDLGKPFEPDVPEARYVSDGPQRGTPRQCAAARSS